MKISKRQLKRIIREEYSRLKRQGLITEDSTGGMRARSDWARAGEQEGMEADLMSQEEVVAKYKAIKKNERTPEQQEIYRQANLGAEYGADGQYSNAKQYARAEGLPLDGQWFNEFRHLFNHGMEWRMESQRW